MLQSNPFSISFKDLGAGPSNADKFKLKISGVFVYNPTIKPPREFKDDEDRCQSE